MSSPYQRRTGFRLAWWQLVLLTGGIVVIVFGWLQLGPQSETTDQSATLVPGLTPTSPPSLTQQDVLPTPTIDPQAIPRSITFPGAITTSRIINASRTATSWETRYLGDAVGHLQGTSWIGGAGGNIVLAGHVTNERGEPGPFAYLFEAEIGDDVILTDGEEIHHFAVAAIEEVDPAAVEYVAQDGAPRLTLITCDDWDNETGNYNQRLILIAEPVENPSNDE